VPIHAEVPVPVFRKCCRPRAIGNLTPLDQNTRKRKAFIGPEGPRGRKPNGADGNWISRNRALLDSLNATGGLVGAWAVHSDPDASTTGTASAADTCILLLSAPEPVLELIAYRRRGQADTPMPTSWPG
jgi:hypothetical protein